LVGPPDLARLARAIRQGDRARLARAITLIESRRRSAVSNPIQRGAKLSKLEAAVADGRVSPTVAVEELAK